MTAKPPQLTYTVDPTSMRRDEVAQLRVTVENRTGRPCRDVGLTFVLPALLAGTISPHAEDPGWFIGSSDGRTFAASKRRNKPFASGSAVAFAFDGVRPQGAAGDRAAVVIHESIDSNDEPTSVSLEVDIVEAGVAITAFWAEPIEVTPDRGPMLQWRTERAQTASLSCANGSPRAVGLNVPDARTNTKPMQVDAPPAGVDEIAYTLRATDAGGGWTERTITVSVARVRARLWADDATVDAGQKTTLRWQTANATSATLDGEPLTGADLEEGQRAVVAVDSQPFALAAAGDAPGNISTATHAVYWNPVRVDAFDVSVVEVEPGESVRLSWATTSASAVLIAPGPGLAAAAGAVDVHPDRTTTFTLSAIGVAGPGRPTAAVCTRAVSVPRRYFGVAHHNIDRILMADREDGDGTGALSPHDIAAVKATRKIRVVDSGGGPDRIWDVVTHAYNMIQLRNAAGLVDGAPVRFSVVQPPVALAFDLVSLAVCKDSARADTFHPLVDRLQPSLRAWVLLEVRNAGTETWSKAGPNRVEVVASSETTRDFADPAWVDRFTVTALTEESVPPGRLGTFAFPVTAGVVVEHGPHDVSFRLSKAGAAAFGEMIRVHLVVA